jgi:hypothetical protein
LLNSLSDRHIVQIYNREENHLINTVLAIPNYRLQPTGHSRFTFWETPPGTAKAMRAWFYPGDNFGQEFRYPKNLRTLEVASAAVITRTAIATTPEPPPPAVQPEPEPAPPAAKVEVEERKVEEKTEIAQATPAPAATAPPAEPTPAPQPAVTPQELPKTATPYPLFGLGGLFSLGLYGLLRVRKPA